MQLKENYLYFGFAGEVDPGLLWRGNYLPDRTHRSVIQTTNNDSRIGEQYSIRLTVNPERVRTTTAFTSVNAYPSPGHAARRFNQVLAALAVFLGGTKQIRTS